jgi:DNA-binding NarL/FixJ family response regulator
VDDHPAIRYAIRTVLSTEPDIEVCGEASDQAQAVELATRLRPDVMILDLQLGKFNGWSVVQKVRAAQLKAKIIIFSHYVSRSPAGAVYRSQCDAAVSKGTDTAILIEAIRAVHAGGTFFWKPSENLFNPLADAIAGT